MYRGNNIDGATNTNKLIWPPKLPHIVETPKQNELVGGCAGTMYGCCNDGTTPATSYVDVCKLPIETDIRVGNPTVIYCSDNSITACREGTYGCANGSSVGPCSGVTPEPTNTTATCSNTIPDDVVLNVNTQTFTGKCTNVNGDLVCKFTDYCK